MSSGRRPGSDEQTESRINEARTDRSAERVACIRLFVQERREQD